MEKDVASSPKVEDVSAASSWVRDQKFALHHFLSRPALRIPVIIIWVASFGGSLHEAVTTYYYLEIGASTHDIGNLRIISILGLVLLTPVYGSLIDWYPNGINISIRVSSIFCAAGCLLRGLASSVKGLYFGCFLMGMGVSLWSIVLTLVATTVCDENRSRIISSYLAQESLLRIFGKISFKPFDWFLQSAGIDAKLSRQRITMSVCSIFCLTGLFALVVSSFTSRSFLVPPKPSQQVGSKEEKKPGSKQQLSKARAALLCSSVFCIEVSYAIVIITWPLFVKANFGWEAQAYANIVIFSSLVRTAFIFVAAKMEKLASDGHIALTISCCCAASMLKLSFHNKIHWPSHFVPSLLFIANIGFLDPTLNTMISLSVSEKFQGRGFSIIFLLKGIATIFGSWLGSRMYENNSAVVYSTGALLLFFAAVLIVAAQRCSANAAVSTSAVHAL